MFTATLAQFSVFAIDDEESLASAVTLSKKAMVIMNYEHIHIMLL